MGLLSRLVITVASALDRRSGWDKRHPIVGLFVLDGVRARLRRDNLFDVGVPPAAPGDPRTVDARTIDGSSNDLERPRAGSAGTRFGRNSPRTYWFQETEATLLEPNPREVSLRLLTRETFREAESLNVLAAAWIQFEVHDWLHHKADETGTPFELPLRRDDPWPQDERPMEIKRTRPDPTAGGPASPAFFVTHSSHWWDGSQVYGSDTPFAERVRTKVDGKLKIDEDTQLPSKELDPMTPDELAGVAGNFWVGLGLLHTLFMREHNAICDCLRAAHPSWTDDRLYGVARLVNAAVMAKIHTVEWSPAIIAHPTSIRGLRASWYGLLGERFTKRFGRIGRGDLLSGIPGSRTDDHGVPFSLTEEFVAVYRMHPLLPDDFVVKSVGDPQYEKQYEFSDFAAKETRTVLERHGVADLLYSFGIAHPGALVLHNYPKALQDLTRPGPTGEHMDLAATDILRIRESAVPRYNEFRRLFHLKPATSFAEVAEDPHDVALLREIYDDNIERLDLMIGLFAEKPPEGFGFSDTAFRVFLLMAARRLKSDRFFTNDYTPDVYTREGLQWIEDATMVKVLVRHYPELEPVLRNVDNAFKPWHKQP